MQSDTRYDRRFAKGTWQMDLEQLSVHRGLTIFQDKISKRLISFRFR